MSGSDDLRALGAKDIYRYGQVFHKLSEKLEQPKPKADQIVDLLAEISNLKDVEGLSEIGNQAEKWREHLVENKNLTGAFINTSLNDDQKEQLENLGRNWRYDFENALADVYTLNPQVDIPDKKLIQGPQAFLNVDLSEDFEDEFYDLTEACRCLFCGLFTSAEFMSLRAVEGMLRKWQIEAQDPDGRPNWNGALQALEHSDEIDGLSNIRLLDVLRERRNELAHPDRRSSQRDAETTLKQTFTAVEEIYEITSEEVN